jgi:hypothetical protein
MENINNNEDINEYKEEDELDELGIEIPEIDSLEQGKIILTLEDTFLIRLENMSQFGENSIDLNEVEKFLKKFPKHKDKINNILSKAKAKVKNDLLSQKGQKN